MSTNDDCQNDLDLVETTVHSLAQRTSALLALSRRTINPADTTSEGSAQGGDNPTGSSSESIYRQLKWRLEAGEISSRSLVSFTETAVREIAYFDVLIQNLIGYFSRDDGYTPRKKVIPLRPLLEEVVDLFDFLAAEKGVAINILVADELWLKVDRDLILRLLVNVVDNAVKYSYSSSEKGRRRFIGITCKRHTIEGGVRITVSSYGVGVLEEELASGKLFLYGVRGVLARDRERRGMGIGLAEAMRIANAHGGSIEMDSRLQPGESYLTSVNIVLPAT